MALVARTKLFVCLLPVTVCVAFGRDGTCSNGDACEHDTPKQAPLIPQTDINALFQKKTVEVLTARVPPEDEPNTVLAETKIEALDARLDDAKALAAVQDQATFDRDVQEPEANLRCALDYTLHDGPVGPICVQNGNGSWACPIGCVENTNWDIGDNTGPTAYCYSENTETDCLESTRPQTMSVNDAVETLNEILKPEFEHDILVDKKPKEAMNALVDFINKAAKKYGLNVAVTQQDTSPEEAEDDKGDSAKDAKGTQSSQGVKDCLMDFKCYECVEPLVKDCLARA